MAGLTDRVTLSLPVAMSTSGDDEAGRKVVHDHGGRLVSMEEVRKHCNSASGANGDHDAWVVVDGVVYDVSHFLDTHPGGAQVMMEQMVLKSQDVGKVMRGGQEETQSGGRSSHSHSQYAFRMLQQFRIGVLDRERVGMGLQPPNSSKEKKYTVDLNKPLVFQVGKLGADYDEWVHDPIVQKEPPRFFESDIAEFFTRTAWWVIPAVWGPLVVHMTMVALKGGLWVSALPFTMATGAFIWTLIEYLLHRFLFHMKTSNYWFNMAHYFIHGFHHKHPMDGTRLVFPPHLTAVIVIMLWYLFEPFTLIVGRPMKISMFSGGLLMYIIYDLTHYFLHFGTSFNKRSRMLKKYHLNHHFRDQSNSYGVTTPFWDTVFHTFPEKAYKLYYGARKIEKRGG